MASKSIVADLNKGKKLDGDNYDIWHRKIQYILNKQDVLETLTQEMTLHQEQGRIVWKDNLQPFHLGQVYGILP